MIHSVTRRRVIGITAAAAGLSLVPLGRAGRAEASLVTWRGHAMGALASLQIHHHGPAPRGAPRAASGRPRSGGWKNSSASIMTTPLSSR